MNNKDLTQYIGQHGRINYVDSFGRRGEWFGYIREVYPTYVIFQDNETPHRFKIPFVIDFVPVKLPQLY